MASTNDEQQNDHSRPCHCFQEWMNHQELDLSELLRALNVDAVEDGPNDREVILKQLAEQSIRHLQDYCDKRIDLAREDVALYFSPSWCSSFERSLLWLGGCRPTIFIRLFYALCGMQLESQLMELLRGITTGSLGQLSARQLELINDLHSKTIQEEEKLTRTVASLQENIADMLIVAVVRRLSPGYSEPSEEAERAVDEYMHSMVKSLEDADNVRLNTLKELLDILTPVQGVTYLAAGKKLHLCIHEWGKRKDRDHGRN